MHTQNTTFPVLQGETQHGSTGTPSGLHSAAGRPPLTLAASRTTGTRTDNVPDGDEIRGVCHDLRGHLATIRMTVAALQMAEPSLRMSEQLATIEAEVEAACEMVRRVTTHSRRVAFFDLATVMQTSASRARAAGGCVPSFHSEPARVFGDELQASRLVDNLLDNAIRAAGPAGVVEVRVEEHLVLVPEPRQRSLVGGQRASSRRAVLTIEDSGPGFGLGSPGVASLGLHVVRAVLQELGGFLEIGSSALGGALVRVTIPQATS